MCLAGVQCCCWMEIATWCPFDGMPALSSAHNTSAAAPYYVDSIPVRLIDTIKPVVDLLPEVAKAPATVTFMQKAQYTLGALLVLLVMGSTPLYGIKSNTSGDPFFWMRMVLGSNRYVEQGVVSADFWVPCTEFHDSLAVYCSCHVKLVVYMWPRRCNVS